MKGVTFPNGPIKMAGNLHLPEDFSNDRRCTTIVCVHPAGGDKEQTAGLYAAKLADEGFVALAYDASYQGESSGEPRQEEAPYARVEDVRAAVDYSTTVESIDPQGICVLGICSGGGYAINAAMTDPRIKAVGAGSRDKSLHIVEGANHIALYDTPEYVKQALAHLVPLYQNAGKASLASTFVGPLSAHAATNVAKSPASPA
ncbi:MAG TPA: alpha/beta hydrolase [Candidatus Acidoferrales bacterium]|jgi:fermentation-respiration switch protein FrsA (DUF1100 family)|nr:alpha/beta hydrolase [Candidatus Acidoferrales bacterium]